MPKLTLTQDERLDIATGKYRLQKHWRNGDTLWSDFVDKLSTTQRTAETHAEYIAAKTARQAEIKDIGGFVGGYLANGRRKSGNVLHRQLITLDLDFANTDLWDTFTLLFENTAAVMYSTHKHAPESPRYRLIMPLDRTVASDEYEAIARKIAGIIGIELFDPTTFQPERLMYWPSTAKDGVYEYEYQDGKFISADDVLNKYTDWTDSSEWPVSARIGKIIQRNIKKQGDPLEKPGIVGIFCRTYSIADAIEAYLSDVYEPCDIEDRYSYLQGTTAGGLVVYDDKYAYSHHGTDPTSGKLCNAFDLVRLHKFGLKDEDVRADTPINKLPSYLAMQMYAAADKKVRLQTGDERLADARREFADVSLTETDTLKSKGTIDSIDVEPISNEWIADLDIDVKGKYLSTINNVYTVLMNDPALKNRIAFNDFEKREIATKTLPWRKVNEENYNLIDSDDASLRHYMEKAYRISGKHNIQDGLDIVLSKNKFHPVRDYLNSLPEWDGENRVEELFIDYLGAEDCLYTRTATRKWVVAAIARILRPGIKFDYAIVLVGDQGQGKSEIISRLACEKWFSDNFSSVEGSKSIEQIQGAWLIEIAELAGLSYANVEAIKAFIPRRVDRYRVAYGRRLEHFPRQCVFIGTTNNRDFLRDTTGNRRWWPIPTNIIDPIKSIFDDLTPDEVAQLWAEAMILYKAKEPLYLTKELEVIAKKVQAAHMEIDDRRDIIIHYLEVLLPKNWANMDIYERRRYVKDGADETQMKGTISRREVTAAEIWCEALDGLPKDMTRYNTKFVHDIMRQLPNWKMTIGHKKRTDLYGLQRDYCRISKESSLLPMLPNVTTN